MSEYIFVTNIFEYSNIRIYSSHSGLLRFSRSVATWGFSRDSRWSAGLSWSTGFGSRWPSMILFPQFYQIFISGSFPQEGPSCSSQRTRSSPTTTTTTTTLLLCLWELGSSNEDAGGWKGAPGSADHSRESKEHPGEPAERNRGAEAGRQDEHFLRGWEGLWHRLQAASNNSRGGWRRSKRRENFKWGLSGQMNLSSNIIFRKFPTILLILKTWKRSLLRLSSTHLQWFWQK